ncbi:MAG: transketolase [Deltaproteobacteria bacterium]|nr:transketolase [Deltaproteobacteria bacterium]
MSDHATLAANTIRGLAIDAVQAANSGHPGMPLGMADVATVLWSRFINYDPADPSWPDRDRFVLSGGHGSMLLYAMLHLTGQSLTLDDLRNFRQWGSKTAGHPEFGEAPGIECTTGPLGQGIAMAVGMALAEAHLRARFGEGLVNHFTWAMCGDGDLMEGIASEAASLAGHLGLGRLVVVWDDNGITIDGSTSIAFSEDVPRKFEAMGWHVARVDGHDQAAIAAALAAARDVTDRPSLVCARTRIGFGSPNKEGKSAAHGAPLGVDEVKLTKARLGLDPEQSFAVPQAALDFFRARDAERGTLRAAWQRRVAHSEQRAAFEAMLSGVVDTAAVSWPAHAPGPGIATRKASEMAIQAIAAACPTVLGGSADLAESNLTHVKGSPAITRENYAGRNINFGIREHAMAAVCNGLSLHGGLRPYCATFLIFHDYHRPSFRLSALMHQPVVYVYTHDSVWLGEDGPTHQPTETLQAIRLVPNGWLIRPADAAEANVAWAMALERRDGPVALALTRQNLATLDRGHYPAAENIRRGAYVLREAESARVTLVATGSEVHLALAAAEVLAAEGIGARVVNMACTQVFDAQPRAYREAVLGAAPRVSVEAGATLGWQRYASAHVGIDRFGASAPGKTVSEKLGMNVPNIVAVAREAFGG